MVPTPAVELAGGNTSLAVEVVEVVEDWLELAAGPDVDGGSAAGSLVVAGSLEAGSVEAGGSLGGSLVAGGSVDVTATANALTAAIVGPAGRQFSMPGYCAL